MDRSLGGFIPFPTFTEARGSLTVVDFAEFTPFTVRRAFYIYGVPSDAVRANHATYSPEFIICTSGSCRLHLHDGKQEITVALTSPREGYYVPPQTWRSLDAFSGDCTLLCFSDRPYSAEDRIDSFTEFLALKRKNLPD